MPYAISDFSHKSYQYLSDRGTKLTCSMRTAVHDGLKAAFAWAALGDADGTETGSIKPNFARHVWAEAIQEVAGAADIVHRKRIPVAAAHGGSPDTQLIGGKFTCDGLTWTITGYVGERDRGHDPKTSQ